MENETVLDLTKKTYRPRKTIFLYILLILSTVGVIDSLYLSNAYATNTPLVCGILDGCNEVASSEYSRLFNIPLPFFGVIFYSFIFILSVIHLIKQSPAIRGIILITAAIGFITSLYLTYLQLFVIHAICLYCIASAINSLLLFIVSAMLYRHN